MFEEQKKGTGSLSLEKPQGPVPFLENDSGLRNRDYLFLFASSSAIFIARTFRGSPNRVMNPDAS